MNFLVYGAGALGQALGGLLLVSGHNVDFIIRKRYIKPLSSAGLRITGIFGDYYIAPDKLRLFEGMETLDPSAYDYVLVCVKSYDTEKTVERLIQFKALCSVVSLQNGYGNYELFAEAFGEDRVLGGRVITGFEITKPGEVRITVHADAIHIGALKEGDIPLSAVELARMINEAGIPAEATATIDRDRWAKMLYNCALNPPGAILGVNYGALADDTGIRGIMKEVVREIFHVMEKIGAVSHWDSPEEYLDIFYSKQIPATYDHFPSMLQDLKAGKKTEIEALNGAVVALGEKHGVPTPVNNMLTNLIRFKEQNSNIKLS